MKRIQSILVGLVVVACFFLVGFKKHEAKHKPSTKPQHLIGDAEQQPLDLTVPQRNVSFGESQESFSTAQGKLFDGISVGKRGKSRAVELQGHLIMSQEPEAEKAKSTDGAGIVINLHH